MPKRYYINEEQVAELEAARKKNKNKNVEKRLKALLLHAQGCKCEEIAEKTGYAATSISPIVARYCTEGLPAIVENHYPGNHRNMSFEEEEEIIKPFLDIALAGQMIEVSAILKAYEEKLGRSTETDHGRIYRVLERHGWRKIMPRSKHPNAADEATQEASKKLTVRF
jgi:transposase